MEGVTGEGRKMGHHLGSYLRTLKTGVVSPWIVLCTLEMVAATVPPPFLSTASAAVGQAKGSGIGIGVHRVLAMTTGTSGCPLPCSRCQQPGTCCPSNGLEDPFLKKSKSFRKKYALPVNFVVLHLKLFPTLIEAVGLVSPLVCPS
jgi:hypothetical protein